MVEVGGSNPLGRTNSLDIASPLFIKPSARSRIQALNKFSVKNFVCDQTLTIMFSYDLFVRLNALLYEY